MNRWESAVANILPRKFSDHSPIILVNNYLDFGPIPFKIFYSWCMLKGLDDVVMNAWKFSIQEGTSDRILSEN